MPRRLISMRTGDAAASVGSANGIVREWDTSALAVVVCDMWDAHHCVTAARRTAILATPIDRVVRVLRADGALIIHAPADCATFYAGMEPRTRASGAPTVRAPSAIDWNDWEQDERDRLADSLINPGPCMCTDHTPCNNGEPPYPWTRQTPIVEIASADAVTDDGQEVFNLLEQREIVDILVMGVHTNVCILGRPYGIRQLVRLGKRPVLCRDLTDAFHRDHRGLRWGTPQVVAHIERRWCPSVTSDQLAGGTRFVFADDGART